MVFKIPIVAKNSACINETSTKNNFIKYINYVIQKKQQNFYTIDLPYPQSIEDIKHIIFNKYNEINILFWKS